MNIEIAKGCRFVAVVAVLLARISLAADLQWAGVVGNSGEQGNSLIRSTFGRGGGGLVVDPQGRIVTSGGDRILVLDRDGKLLWSTKLPKPGWVIGSADFAIVGQSLYFIAGEPVPYEKRFYQVEWTMVEPNLCRVALKPDAAAEIAADRNEFSDYHRADRQMEISLASSPDASELFVGYSLSWSDQPIYSIYKLNAGHLDRCLQFAVRGYRFSIDERGDIYIGGGGTIRKFDSQGKPVAGFPSFHFPLRLGNADFYAGAVMLTPGAIWEWGGFGFVGRYTRDLKESPGSIAQWNHAVSNVAQVADAGGGSFYLKSSDATYIVTVEGDQLRLKKRFGSLPDANGLGLTPDGYVAIANPRTVLWFDFDQSLASAAPVRAQYYGPTTQGFTDGDGWTSLLVKETGTMLVRYAPEPFNHGGNPHQVLATAENRVQLSSVTRVGTFLFAIDPSRNLLVRCPDAPSCDFVAVDPAEVGAEFAGTSLAGLGRNILVAASGSRVDAFEVDAKGSLKPLWNLTTAADPKDLFGQELYVAASGGQLIVADTRRSRILLFSMGEDPHQPPKFEARFGQTDVAGDDASHLDQPTLVAVSAARVAVYDSANQRVIKLRIR